MARFVRSAALVLAATLVASTAQADPCFDASDEARSLLAHRQLLEARARLRVCAASSCDEPVRVLCDERLAEVGARLPTIIFDVKDPAGHDLSNVALTVDGAAYADGGQGAEITLDPGRHVFRFEAEHQAPLELSFVLVEREKGRREHVVIGAVAVERAPLVATAPEVPPQAPDAVSPWRTAGWITLGAAAVGLGIGTTFGIVAITKNGEASCDANDVCTDPRSRHDARVAANVSTAGVVIGGVLAAAAVTVLVFGPKTTKRPGVSNVSMSTAGSGGSLILEGHW
jgi:serine/threonine-protein kinase